MGRIYTAVVNQVAVTAVQDFFEVIAPSTAAVIIHDVSLSQSSDPGDAQAEMLHVLIHRGTASGSGGASVTPSPMSVGDSAFGGTVERNNTTQSAEGTILLSEAFNVQVGFVKIWTPETRPVVSPSGLFIVELSAPADSLTMDGTITFEEIGT